MTPLITCQSQKKHSAQTSGAQRPQINTLLYTPLGPEAWLSTISKRRISSASTFVTRCHIRTSAIYHCPVLRATKTVC